MLVEATCMCAPALSMWRKDESRPVRRSALTGKSSHTVEGVLRSAGEGSGGQAGEGSGGQAEPELPLALLRRGGVAIGGSKGSEADAEQAHRALWVVGAQQVEGNRPDHSRVVGRRVDGVGAADVGPV